MAKGKVGNVTRSSIVIKESWAVFLVFNNYLQISF